MRNADYIKQMCPDSGIRTPLLLIYNKSKLDAMPRYFFRQFNFGNERVKLHSLTV